MWGSLLHFKLLDCTTQHVNKPWPVALMINKPWPVASTQDYCHTCVTELAGLHLY